MTLETEVLISALKLTRKGHAQIEDVSRDAGVPVEVVFRIIRRSAERGFLQLEDKTVIMNEEERLKTAVYVVELGADLERVCSLLRWDEFEDVSALAFERAGFSVKKHFRFKHLEKRWEIDILALKNPIVASVDCKHWHRGLRRSSTAKIVESHIKRTQALGEASPILRGRVGIARWKGAEFVPIVLSLTPSDSKFFEGVPIVPILQLRNFLEEMPAYMDSLAHFSRKLT